MTPDLEAGKRDSRHYNIAGGISDSVSQGGNVHFEGGEDGREPGEEDAKRGDEAELY